ncbi:glycosyltransferase [Pseudomonas cavernae]|uniref:Glycosyltransferase n=2 Tax=Pseudomonas cavernae TaxID=2320867 RepID=A0A385Z709_9PSED|nr:glycosyltransferase [Pseudomonas cavernae]
MSTATVVVSCYNQEQYIRDCLESILSQKTDFSFDILVSDDCSVDRTQSIIKEYADKQPEKFKLILREKNVGVSINYTRAHNSATGDVVFHIDGDDVMLPGKLQKQFDLFRGNSDVNLVFHRARYFSDDGSYEIETGSPSLQEGGLMHFGMSDLALWGPITVHSAYAYRRNSRRTRTISSDFTEWFFALDSLSQNGRAIYIDEVLVKYRCNPSGSTYLSTKIGRVKVYSIYFRDVFHYYRSCPGVRKQLYANCLFTSLAMLRAKCGFSTEAIFFLIRNIYNFRPWLLFDVFKMRKSVAPEQRIR